MIPVVDLHASRILRDCLALMRPGDSIHIEHECALGPGAPVGSDTTVPWLVMFDDKPGDESSTPDLWIGTTAAEAFEQLLAHLQCRQSGVTA
jgi:hypothetical protein